MNEQPETMEQPMESVQRNDGSPVASYPEARTSTAISPQAGTGTCSSCGGAAGTSLNDSNGNGDGMNTFVYAIGRVEARFPNLAAEKEFAQATGRADTAGKTDQQAFHEVLSQRQNRYLL